MEVLRPNSRRSFAESQALGWLRYEDLSHHSLDSNRSAPSHFAKDLHMFRKVWRLAFLSFLSALIFIAPATAFAETTKISIEHLTFDTNAAGSVKPAKIKATLYLPARSAPIPAMIIISSSGGGLDFIEGYYAREFDKTGVPSLVVDSFGTREVEKAIEDAKPRTAWEIGD